MDEHGLIGIVSGLGPLAGSDVLDQALAYAAEAYGATEDADYPDIVLFSHGIESFDATGSMERSFVQELVRVVQEVELHHPTVVGIACNTALPQRAAGSPRSGASRHGA
jgi:aspartate/glutamate racemase